MNRSRLSDGPCMRTSYDERRKKHGPPAEISRGRTFFQTHRRMSSSGGPPPLRPPQRDPDDPLEPGALRSVAALVRDAFTVQTARHFFRRALTDVDRQRALDQTRDGCIPREGDRLDLLREVGRQADRDDANRRVSRFCLCPFLRHYEEPWFKKSAAVPFGFRSDFSEKNHRTGMKETFRWPLSGSLKKSTVCLKRPSGCKGRQPAGFSTTRQRRRRLDDGVSLRGAARHEAPAMPTKARRGDALPKTPPSGGRTLSFYPVPLIYKVGCRKRHGPAIEEDEPRGDARLGARGGTAPGRRRLLEVGILGIRGSVFSFRRIFSSLGVPDLVSEFAGVAEQIQRALLDVGIPSLPGLDVGIRAAPARLVGGDYLDIITRPGRAPLFAIGDVSGKSLPAAMRAVMLKYLVRGLTVALTDDLALILRQANAGHDPPLAYRASQGKIEHLPPSGLVLGVERGTRYRVQTTMLEPEDAIVFYTDGFTDARSPGGEQFTLARIEEGLMEMRALTAQAMAEALFERVEAHAAGTLADDASIMVVRVTQ